MATMQSALRQPAVAGVRAALREVVGALASVRFAAMLGAGLAVLGLAGILVPQLPEAARGDPTATAAWLDQRRAVVGPFADWLYRLQVYEIFHSAWLATGMALLALSVVACTARRVLPLWRNVTRPVRVVPEAFLDAGRSSVVSGTRLEPAAFERELTRRHFRVERREADGVTWFFADRYAWAQLATFVSHAALVVLLAGVLVTRFAGFTSRLFVVEGGNEPVFGIGHQPGMNIAVKSTSAAAPADSSSQIAVTSEGRVVKNCTLSASQACSYDGYRIRQAFAYPYGAELEVRSASDGRVLYHESVPLTAARQAPHVVISDAAGQVIFDQAVALTGSVNGVDGASVVVPGLPAPLWVGLTSSEGAPELVAFAVGEGSAGGLIIPVHGSGNVGSLRLDFAGLETAPAGAAPDLPVPAEGTPSSPLLQLVPSIAGGSSTLSVSGLGDLPLTLPEGGEATAGDLVYRFVAQKPFVGIEVTKDRGESLIWIGSALLVLGLCVTLWVPRRRIWARIDAEGARMAGNGPRLANLPAELASLVADAGERTTAPAQSS